MGLPIPPPENGPLRRSEWRVRGDDPKGLVGWWWYGIVYEDRFLGLQLLGLAGIIASFLFGIAGFQLFALFAIVAMMIRKRKTPDRLAALLPEPAPKGQFRATISYHRDRMITGRDEMALTFVDGWLYAEGLRSNFSLRAEDISKLRTGSDRTGMLWLVDGSELRILGMSDEGRVALERWYRAKLPVLGVSTFPPHLVHVQQYSRWYAYGYLGAVLLAFEFFGTFPIHGIHTIGRFPLLSIVAGVIASWSIVGWKRVFKLAKIDRQTWRGSQDVIPDVQGRFQGAALSDADQVVEASA